jgi:hypothetical protein
MIQSDEIRITFNQRQKSRKIDEMWSFDATAGYQVGSS